MCALGLIILDLQGMKFDIYVCVRFCLSTDFEWRLWNSQEGRDDRTGTECDEGKNVNDKIHFSTRP